MVTRITITINAETLTAARKYCLKNDIALSRFITRSVNNELLLRELGAVSINTKTAQTNKNLNKK